MKKYPVILLLLFVISLVSCRKDPAGPDPGGPPDTEVTAGLQGRVVDESGVPVKGADVAAGMSTTTTDENGIFSFSKLTMSSRWGFVKVSKTGYFTGSRTILTAENAQNYVTIRLIPRVVRGTFAASAGGTVEVNGDHSVEFEAASVSMVGGAAYTGTVHVYASYLDPTDAGLSSFMPGDLRGIGADGKETGLQSFGMMAVELAGDGGEKLQIADGKKATLRFAIPASLQGAAPATIPLWYFNDTTGKWMVQGSAIKQGNQYVGQVGHFTFWNCDVAVSVVTFKAKFKDQHGNPLAYKSVQFTATGFGTRGAPTDVDGSVEGLLPKDQNFRMQVLDDCGNVLHTQTVGPVTGPLDLGTVTVTDNTVAVIITGEVVDCKDQPVASGSVNAVIEGRHYGAAVKNGTFTLSLGRCTTGQTNVLIKATNFADNGQGAEVSIPVATGSVDAGTLKACGVMVEQYVHLTINGKNYDFISNEYPDALDYNDAAGRSMTIFAENGSVTPTYHATIILRGLAGPGTGELFECELSEDWGELYNLVTVDKFMLTAQGGVGKPVEANFSGTVKKDSEAAAVPMSGYLRITQLRELDN